MMDKSMEVKRNHKHMYSCFDLAADDNSEVGNNMEKISVVEAISPTKRVKKSNTLKVIQTKRVDKVETPVGDKQKSLSKINNNSEAMANIPNMDYIDDVETLKNKTSVKNDVQEKPQKMTNNFSKEIYSAKLVNKQRKIIKSNTDFSKETPTSNFDTNIRPSRLGIID